MGQFHLAISPTLKSDLGSTSLLRKWKNSSQLPELMGAMDIEMPR
jgi:hypothetical protein